MERLTERYDDIVGLNPVGDNPYALAMSKLAECEDLEEAGRLVKLPCAVGDILLSLLRLLRE